MASVAFGNLFRVLGFGGRFGARASSPILPR